MTNAIGHMKDGSLFIEGVFATLKFDQKVDIRPLPVDQRGQSKEAPTHEVWGYDEDQPDRDPVKIGSGWQREMKRGQFVGESMVSCTMSDPSFIRYLGTADVSFAAFPREPMSPDGAAFDFVNERPRQA